MCLLKMSCIFVSTKKNEGQILKPTVREESPGMFPSKSVIKKNTCYYCKNEMSPVSEQDVLCLDVYVQLLAAALFIAAMLNIACTVTISKHSLT